MSNGPVFEAEPGWGGRLPHWFVAGSGRTTLFVLIIVVLAWSAFIAFSKNGIRHAGENFAAINAPAPSATPQIDTITASSYTVPVVPGDSYTTIARRTILKHDMTTKDGQFLYTETLLAQKLKNQPLKVGSVISISGATIDEIKSTFLSLSLYQKESWRRLERKLLPR